MAEEFDPRVTPVRDGVAAAHLRGLVSADRFIEGRPARVVSPVLDVHGSAGSDGALTTQLLYGETVMVFGGESDAGYAWLQNDTDQYVGFVCRDGLGELCEGKPHYVTSRTAQVYGRGALKAPPLLTLPQMSVVHVRDTSCSWAACGGGTYVSDRQIAPVGAIASDFVAFALGYLGAPYLWGGRSILGLDCSALVQLALQAAGRRCPRDSDMQQALGDDIDGPERRGDLIFWKGHVGIMVDGRDMVHANAHHMQVVVEPLAEAIGRIDHTDGPVVARKRLDLAALPAV